MVHNYKVTSPPIYTRQDRAFLYITECCVQTGKQVTTWNMEQHGNGISQLTRADEGEVGLRLILIIIIVVGYNKKNENMIYY